MRACFYWATVPGRIVRVFPAIHKRLPLYSFGSVLAEGEKKGGGGGRWRLLVQFISDLPNQLHEETRLREYSSSIKNTQFCATVPGFQPSLKRLIVQQPKDKGSSPSARREQCVEVWVVMQITNCTGHRGKREGNGSLSARHAEGGEGRTGVSLPPFSFSLSLSFSFFFTLSTLNWQLAGKWMRCEVSPLKCRVLLFRQQRSSMRDICCSVIRIHLVTCLPSLALSPFLFHRGPATSILSTESRAFSFSFLPTALQRHSSSDHSSADPPLPFSFSHLPP